MKKIYRIINYKDKPYLSLPVLCFIVILYMLYGIVTCYWTSNIPMLLHGLMRNDPVCFMLKYGSIFYHFGGKKTYMKGWKLNNKLSLDGLRFLTSFDCLPLYDIFLMATTSLVRMSWACERTGEMFYLFLLAMDNPFPYRNLYWPYLQSRQPQSFHGQSHGDLWRVFLDLPWRRAQPPPGPSDSRPAHSMAWPAPWHTFTDDQ